MRGQHFFLPSEAAEKEPEALSRDSSSRGRSRGSQVLLEGEAGGSRGSGHFSDTESPQICPGVSKHVTMMSRSCLKGNNNGEGLGPKPLGAVRVCKWREHAELVWVNV